MPATEVVETDVPPLHVIVKLFVPELETLYVLPAVAFVGAGIVSVRPASVAVADTDAYASTDVAAVSVVLDANVAVICPETKEADIIV